MNNEIDEKIKKEIVDFKLPRYKEIPDVGLHLEQVVRLINGYYEMIGGIELTASMISNYVKQSIVDRPVKKQYNRERIAHLIFISVAKKVVSLDDIKKILILNKQYYEPEQAYDYFCREFENVLQFIFNNKDELEEISISDNELKELLRNIIVTMVHRIHLEKYMREVL